MRITNQVEYKRAVGSSQALFDVNPPVHPSGTHGKRYVSCPSVPFSLGPEVQLSASSGPLDSNASGFCDLASGFLDVSLRITPSILLKRGFFWPWAAPGALFSRYPAFPLRGGLTVGDNKLICESEWDIYP